MSAGAFLDARRRLLILALVLGQHEFAVAVGALDEVLAAHFHVDARMAQRAPDPVAAHPMRVDQDGLRRFNGGGGDVDGAH